MSIKNIFNECMNKKYRIGWFLLLLIALMGMADIPPVNNLKIALPLWVKWTGICLIAALKASIIMLLWCLCKRHLITRIAFYLFVGIFGLLCIVNFFCLHFYEMGLSNKMIILIAETNPSEAAEFFSTSLGKIKEAISWSLFYSLLGIFLIFVVIKCLPQKMYDWMVGITSAIGLIFFCILVADTFDGKNFYSVYARTAKSVLVVYRESNELKALMEKLPPYENASSVASNRNAFNIVVVYGESADRDHLSIYGYKLPTSPLMDSISDNLFVFNDVISAEKLTKQSMEHMLTLQPDSATSNWWSYPLLIDIMKAAGYKTHWVSNQERTGLLSNSIGAIASRADEVNYISKSSNSDALLQKYDEALLPELKKILADTVTPKWIGLHMMGSHFVYENRYPESFNHFSAKDVENAHPREWMGEKQYKTEAQYDNSILYTDYVVGNMIKQLSEQSKPSLLIYLSDHGENVYADRDYCGRDITSVRIPFVVYANESFAKDYPYIIEALGNALNLKISSANLPYAIMTLTGTKGKDYNAKSDFLSPMYEEKVRYVAGKPWSLDDNKH